MPRKKVLFVGAIDGAVELEFLWEMGFEKCEVYVTSYLAGPLIKQLVEEYKGPHRIIGSQNINATDLIAKFPKLRFDAVAWLGPTNDDDKGATAALVQSFVNSARQVLATNGVIYVLQDLKTPNFRKIVKIPGAYFLRQMSLEGRTQTQSSSSSGVKRLEGRTDQLFGFKTEGDSSQIKDLNNEGNDRFEDILSRIMSSKAELWKKPGSRESSMLSKKQIADLIFEFASS